MVTVRMSLNVGCSRFHTCNRNAINYVSVYSTWLHVTVKNMKILGVTQEQFMAMYSSLTNKCTFLFKKHIKIYIKIHINIAPTCFGLRPSSGSLH